MPANLAIPADSAVTTGPGGQTLRCRVFVVTLPLPPRDVSPNGRCHWAAKHRAVTAYRKACAATYKQAGIPALEIPVTLRAEFFLCRPNAKKDPRGAYSAQGLYFPIDADNAAASLKAAQDALVDAGVIPGDSARMVRMESPTLHRVVKEHRGRTELVLTIQEGFTTA